MIKGFVCYDKELGFYPKAEKSYTMVCAGEQWKVLIFGAA